MAQFYNDDFKSGGTGQGTYILEGISAAAVPLTVKAYTGQTANVLEVQNAAGTVLFSVDNSGNVTYLGDEYVTDALTVNGNASVTGTLGVTGAVTLSSTLGVSGAATFDSGITVTGDSSIEGTTRIHSLRVEGDLNLQSGYIRSLYSANLHLLPGPSCITIVGDAGTTSHTLNTNDDLFVTGRLEVDGMAYFDGGSTAGVSFADDTPLYFGTSNDASITWNTTENVDAWYFGTATGQNTLIIAEIGDIAYDFAHGAQTNPTVFIQSATQSATQWGSLTHDQTDFLLSSGAGAVRFAPATNVTATLPAAGKVYINGTSTANTGTAGVLDIDVTTATTNVSGIDLSFTSTATGGQTNYGIKSVVASAAVVTATNQSMYSGYFTATKSGADTNAATTTVYGIYVEGKNTGATNTGTKDTYGVYCKATGDANGTSTAIGIYAEASGADNNFAGVFSGDIVPLTSDGSVLGSGTRMFSDLYLASGAVINFNNGDVTITHVASDEIDINGGTTVFLSGAVQMGNATTDCSTFTMIKGAQTSDPQVQFALSGDANGDFSITADTGDITLTAADDFFVSVDGNVELALTGAALYPYTDGGLTLGITNTNEWGGLYMNSASVISWDNGDVTLTHSANDLALGGGNFTINGLEIIAPVATGNVIDMQLETEWTTGSLINADFGSATVQSGDITGLYMDFNANLAGVTDKDTNGVIFKSQALTQSAANTTTYTGFSIPTAGALVQSAEAGTINWYGAKFQMPNITQTTGTVTSYGLHITGGTVTSGTEYGLYLSSCDAYIDGNLMMSNGSYIGTGKTASDILYIGAYDTNTGPAYVAFITLTAGTDPTCVLASGVTATTQSAHDNSTKIATTAYVDAAITGHDTLSEVLAVGNTTGAYDIIVSAGQAIASAGSNGNTMLLKANDTTFITFTTNATDTCVISGAAIDSCIIGAGGAAAATVTTLAMGGALTGATTIACSAGITQTTTVTGTLYDMVLETEWTGGTLINADFGSATVQATDMLGVVLDFNANMAGVTDKDVTGFVVKTPALTQSTTNTTTYIGYNLPTAGALVQDTDAGTIAWRGLNIQCPNITQTTGAVTSYGIYVNGGTVTSGTQWSIFVDAGNVRLDGTLGDTTNRVLYGWFTDLVCTNAIQGSITGNAATVTVVDTSDTSCYVALFGEASGSLAAYTDTGITYNAGTGVLTATGFAGPLTGNVTGNCSGTADTVTNATQASITTCANLTTVGTIATGVWQGTTIKANYLQQAAADLGDADINLDFSNSNTGNVTNLTIDGTFQALSIGVTGTRIANGFFTDLAVTNTITGNVSGTAATVTGATQASITTCANLTTVGTIGTGVWQGTTIKANYLQQAAADLGAASITVDLSNSNGSYVTNLTIDGTLTAGYLAATTLSGSITFGENTALIHDNALSDDGKYTGEVVAGTAGANLAFGDLVYLDPTDSKWELTDANSASGADGDARGLIGICVLAANENAATTILLRGMVRADTAFPAITVNGPVYVSETAGDVTMTQPSTTDNVIRVIGQGFDANTIYFNPSPDWITCS